jgi:mono/diheme cytochrome c family protein
MRHILLLMICIVGMLTGCQQEMAEQPSYRPLEESAFFPDERSARPLPAGAVPRGPLQVADPLYSGLSDHPTSAPQEYTSALPFPLTQDVLRRGQERFEIFCSVCHGADGQGNGKIVQRGYTRPPNYVTDLSRGFERRGIRIRLRDVPIGYFFEVISKGYGAMPDYETQVPPQDRWAIAAYVRALQISQHLRLQDLPEEERANILSQVRGPQGKDPVEEREGEAPAEPPIRKNRLGRSLALPKSAAQAEAVPPGGVR